MMSNNNEIGVTGYKCKNGHAVYASRDHCLICGAPTPSAKAIVKQNKQIVAERDEEDRQEIIRQIHKLYQKYKRVPGNRMYLMEYKTSMDKIIRLFGSWKEAVEASGLRANTPGMYNPKEYSKEEMIRFLREYKEKHGRMPVAADCGGASGLPGHAAYRDKFGSWLLAKELAFGRLARTKTPSIEDEKLLQSIRDFYEAYKRPPTATETTTDSALHSHSTYARRFGSFDNAVLFALGPPDPADTRQLYSTYELLSYIRKYKQQEGKEPNAANFRDKNYFPCNHAVYHWRFGGINQAKDWAFGRIDLTEGTPATRLVRTTEKLKDNDKVADPTNSYRVPRNRYNRMSDDELISILVRFKEAYGREPNTGDAREGRIPTWDIYKKRFGTWWNALDKAFGGKSM